MANAILRHHLAMTQQTTTMGIRFFPASRQFWFYHLGAGAFCMAVTLLTVVLWSPLALLDGVSTLLWLPPYTLAVLAFRWLYRRRGWKSMGMGRLVLLAVVYASAAAVLVTASVAAMTLPFFWDDVAVYYAKYDMTLDPLAYLLRTIYGASLQAQVFICAWIFIYISFTGSRDAREGALQTAHLQNALHEAQLRSLSNQLNPHFLFNSLNNIRFMIHEDAQRADAMLVGLSEILRYSLAGDERRKVPLAEERAIVERYLAIAGAGLEERLRVRIDIPPQLDACLVPPLLLQMLAENAVKHGIEPLREGGALHLSGRQDGALLRLEVINDKPAQGGHCGLETGMGIGMRHLAQRLGLLYGERAWHELHDSGASYRVALALPLETAP